MKRCTALAKRAIHIVLLDPGQELFSPHCRQFSDPHVSRSLEALLDVGTRASGNKIMAHWAIKFRYTFVF